MGITVKLNGGVEIHVGGEDFAALQEAFQASLIENKPLRIHSPDGRTVVLNPHNILYVEGPTDEQVSANGASVPATADSPA